MVTSSFVKSRTLLAAFAILVVTAGAAAQNAPATPADLPFTKQLSRSFGDFHEVVSHSLFVGTLMGGSLTKAQLEVHLQQRALIHNELHRILNGSAAEKSGLYGAEQKALLPLLFNDLLAMGSGWPTEPQARPLTKAFLHTIRESERQGPYFALGVLHVYYGGITNGGRQIGRIIAETTKVTPDYYLKTDGYRAYLAEVDKITDPGARSEMLRGGQEAYRYIIASNNEDVFRGDAR